MIPSSEYGYYFSNFPGDRENVRLKRSVYDVDGDKMAGKQSLITRIGILSVPGALPLAIDMMTFCFQTSFR